MNRDNAQQGAFFDPPIISQTFRKLLTTEEGAANTVSTDTSHA